MSGPFDILTYADDGADYLSDGWAMSFDWAIEADIWKGNRYLVMIYRDCVRCDRKLIVKDNAGPMRNVQGNNNHICLPCRGEPDNLDIDWAVVDV